MRQPGICIRGTFIPGSASRLTRVMTRFTTMGDKLANKKKKAQKAAKPAPKAPTTVAEIRPAAPRK